MISIRTDEASAFDLLSILQIKAVHGLQVLQSIDQLEGDIMAGIGFGNFSDVASSDEYNSLWNANQRMWYIQEKAMRDECKASDVDRQNQARFHAKAALQKKFFNTELTEKKTVRPYEVEGK